MTNLIRIAESVLNRPLLVHPDKVPLILSVLSGRIPLDSEAIADLRERSESQIDGLPNDAQIIMRGPAPDASRFVGSSSDTDPTTGRSSSLPYRRTSQGVAIISILGGLANRGTSLQGGSMSRQSYEGIKFQLAHAGGDPKTTSVVLDLQSPGGEAIGAFEAADAVRALASKKPVIAVVNGMAASAAYAIASAASKIVTTPTGLSGSVGVVMVHADYSRALDREGVKPTMIFAGQHKVDGNPFEPLSDTVRSDLQAEVNQFYEMFVATVAKGRPGMSSKAIRETEARTFMGADAVRVGLADEVGSFETAIAELTRGHTAHISSVSGRSTAPRADINPAAIYAVRNGTAPVDVSSARAVSASEVSAGRAPRATERRAEASAGPMSRVAMIDMTAVYAARRGGIPAGSSSYSGLDAASVYSARAGRTTAPSTTASVEPKSKDGPIDMSAIYADRRAGCFSEPSTKAPAKPKSQGGAIDLKTIYSARRTAV